MAFQSTARTVALVVALAACAPVDDPLTRAQAMAIAGPWNPPASTRAIAATMSVPVVDPPAVSPGGSCTSTDPFRCSCTHPACHSAFPGTRDLNAYLLRRFPYLRAGGTYCCRQNSATTSVPMLSVHALGRAIDLMVTRVGGDADNTLGDPVANFLVEHAEDIGIQRVIWDHTYWNGRSGFGPLSSASLPHTDHIHVELSVAGANRTTPFFTSGAISGGVSCTASCVGALLLNADCTSRDCAAAGTACVAAPTPHCATAACPPTGTASICLDNATVANCAAGRVTGTGDCARFAAMCSTAGVAPTAARCVSVFCVSSPNSVPTEHSACFLSGGERLDCHADGTSTVTRCPSGQACVQDADGIRCEAASPVCPLRATSATPFDHVVCIDDHTIARCYNGNQHERRPCGPGRVCIMAGAEAQCAVSACLDGARTRTTPVCVDGYPATCGPIGAVTCVQPCPAGTRCETSSSGALTCVPGEPGGLDLDELPDGSDCGISLALPDAGTPDAGVRDASLDVTTADDVVSVRDASVRDVAVADVPASDSGVFFDPNVPAPDGCACRATPPSGAGAGPTRAWVLGAVGVCAARGRRRAGQRVTRARGRR